MARKFIHVITNFEKIGGAEMALSRLINGLSTDSHVVIALRRCSVLDQGLISSTEVKFLSLNIRGPVSFIAGLARCVSLFRSVKPSICVSWMYHANIFAILPKVLSLTPAKVIWTIHHALDDLENERASTRFAIRIGAWLSWAPNKIVYVSMLVRSQHENSGYRSSIGFTINHGVQVPSCFLRRTRSSAVIGVMARYHPAKDYPTLLSALANVFDRIPSARAVLGGDGVDSENAELASMITSVGIDSTRIELIGLILDKAAFFSSIDVFVVSSATEAGPISLIEAMSYGVPSVCTDVGDAKAILGPYGCPVPVRDPIALALEVVRSINAIGNVRNDESIASYIENNFSEKVTVETWDKLVESLIE